MAHQNFMYRAMVGRWLLIFHLLQCVACLSDSNTDEHQETGVSAQAGVERVSVEVASEGVIQRKKTASKLSRLRRDDLARRNTQQLPMARREELAEQRILPNGGLGGPLAAQQKLRQQQILGVNPLLGQQQGILGVNPILGKQKLAQKQLLNQGVLGQQGILGVNPLLGQQQILGVNPLLGQQQGILGVNPILGQQKLAQKQLLNQGVLGQQGILGVNPLLGQQQGILGVNPILGQQKLAQKQLNQGVVGQQGILGVNTPLGQQKVLNGGVGIQNLQSLPPRRIGAGHRASTAWIATIAVACSLYAGLS